MIVAVAAAVEVKLMMMMMTMNPFVKRLLLAVKKIVFLPCSCLWRRRKECVGDEHRMSILKIGHTPKQSDLV